MASKKRTLDENLKEETDEPPLKKRKKHKSKKELFVYIVTIERNANMEDCENEASNEGIYLSRKEANKHAKDLYSEESNGEVDGSMNSSDYLFERWDEPTHKYGDTPVHVCVEKHRVLNKYQK
eukprot:166325_1